MILFNILATSLTFPCFSVRQKQFGTFGKKNIGLKNTKVAWGSRPWRAEWRKCSSQIVFGSLISVSTLAEMLLMMMRVIIFGTIPFIEWYMILSHHWHFLIYWQPQIISSIALKTTWESESDAGWYLHFCRWLLWRKGIIFIFIH